MSKLAIITVTDDTIEDVKKLADAMFPNKMAWTTTNIQVTSITTDEAERLVKTVNRYLGTKVECRLVDIGNNHGYHRYIGDQNG